MGESIEIESIVYVVVDILVIVWSTECPRLLKNNNVKWKASPYFIRDVKQYILLNLAKL